MTATLAPGTRVPNEFLGLARDFCRAVAREDLLLARQIKTYRDPIIERLHTYGRLHPSQITPLLNRWQKVIPRAFALRTETQRQPPTIAEARICSDRWAREDWTQDEPGCTICAIVFSIEGLALHLDVNRLALVGLHSIARWFERAGCRDRQSLIEDMMPLALAGDHSEGEVKCRHGVWRGESVPLEHGDNPRWAWRVGTFIGRDIIRA